MVSGSPVQSVREGGAISEPLQLRIQLKVLLTDCREEGSTDVSLDVMDNEFAKQRMMKASVSSS